MRLPDFEAWAMFAAVVEHRSFTDAARALSVSKATVSKAVTRLEASLGITLLHRSSRVVAVSTAGAGLLDEARAKGSGVRVAASVDWDVQHHFPGNAAASLDRVSQFAIVAAGILNSAMPFVRRRRSATVRASDSSSSPISTRSAMTVPTTSRAKCPCAHANSGMW